MSEDISRNSLAEDDDNPKEPRVQLVIPKRMRSYLRSFRKNALEPSPAQQSHREMFRAVMADEAGKPMTIEGPDGIPNQAAAIRQQLSGVQQRKELKRPPSLKQWEKEVIEYWVNVLKEEIEAEEVLEKIKVKIPTKR